MFLTWCALMKIIIGYQFNEQWSFDVFCQMLLDIQFGILFLSSDFICYINIITQIMYSSMGGRKQAGKGSKWDKILQDESMIQSLEQNSSQYPQFQPQSHTAIKDNADLNLINHKNDRSTIDIKYQSMPPGLHQMKSNNPLQSLSQIQGQIFNQIQTLGSLKSAFYENQEKVFLKTFINIMDRMSNQLVQYKELYRNIDKQIENEEECVKLRQRKNFFEDECLFLKSQYESIQKQRAGIKQNSDKLKKEIQELEQKYKKCKIKQIKYCNQREKAKTCRNGSVNDNSETIAICLTKQKVNTERYHVRGRRARSVIGQIQTNY